MQDKTFLRNIHTFSGVIRFFSALLFLNERSDSIAQFWYYGAFTFASVFLCTDFLLK